MKTTVFLIVVLVTALTVKGQTNSVSVEKAPGTKESEKAVMDLGTRIIPLGPRKPAKSIQANGLAVDLLKTNRPVRLFDLRAPVSETVDRSNISTNPIAGRPAGFRFLSLRF